MSRPGISLEGCQRGVVCHGARGISGRKWPFWSAGVGREGSRVRPEDVECQFLGGNAKPGNAGSSGVAGKRHPRLDTVPCPQVCCRVF